MAVILCIETTTTNCSVAIAENAKLLVFQEEDKANFSHAEKLHLFIDDVLKKAHKSLTEIDAVAVSKGPGSYTGLRIGVSAAKGLCYALEKPLISIDTLEALTSQVQGDAYIIPNLDARRMEIYTAIYFRQNGSLKAIKETYAKVIDENSFKDLDNKKLIFIGNSNQKINETIKVGNVEFIEQNPSARFMVDLAFTKFQQQQFEDVAYFEPFYLKDFVVGGK
ncbi:tRNA (adenosine(37)-N6)-threonylcarbamoyltransferase complex dimerization subunit type 1 TsaB [Mesonia sp. K7]|uniref:tRNA (adenosine(37)-N6)-threonylcarbamoyltransferase complex dimerization subunit type 1 TsaB n=1 Tax=Mesonia sp. K7 TaxID=2218606 RepID=UPI000DAA8C34|nr:tRNA (adenosine(37)-N6)-threonylcarbamoyltransferase complex dimerization subunit type 1 TsaB [Mesonia sp. K7]PZD78746.1 tRNA (adenosine(37)-N6)-threonylcarbamoyltransferase complex dimerization subunit type 1 TsaB [Mesonia sp. K7]